MKKWTLEKIEIALSKGIPSKMLAGRSIPGLEPRLMDYFRQILQIIDNRKLNSQVDIARIIEQTIACQQVKEKKARPDAFLFSPKKYLRSIVEELDRGYIAPEFKPPSIPGKQKRFSIQEIMEYAQVGRRTIQLDQIGKKTRQGLQDAKLIVEDDGYILREHAIRYVNEKKKNQKKS